MNKDLGKQMALQNTDLVSSETPPSIQSQSDVNRNGKCQNDPQSTIDSQTCDNNGPRPSQSQPNPTNIASGISKAHSLSQTSSQGFDFNADPLAQSSPGSNQNEPAMFMKQALNNTHVHCQTSSNEGQYLVNPTADSSSHLERLDHLAKRRRRNQQAKSAVAKVWRRATSGHAAMRRNIETLKQEALQCKETCDVELSERDRRYNERLAYFEAGLVAYKVAKEKEDIEKQNLQEELQKIKKEKQVLSEINTLLSEGQDPILNTYRAKRAAWINAIRQESDNTRSFLLKIGAQVLTLRNRTYISFTAIHNNPTPRLVSNAHQKVIDFRDQLFREAALIMVRFDKECRKRVDIMDSVITQQESSCFLINSEIALCEASMQTHYRQRRAALALLFTDFADAIQAYFLALWQHGHPKQASEMDEYTEILNDLAEMSPIRHDARHPDFRDV